MSRLRRGMIIDHRHRLRSIRGMLDLPSLEQVDRALRIVFALGAG